MLVTFDQLVEDGKSTKQRIDYLLSGGSLIDRNYRLKKETRRQVLRPGEKINLLRLGEGPFPLPIGQDPQEVARQFTVTPLDPYNSLPGLRLTPLPTSRLAQQFQVIDVWIDTAQNMPVKILTTDRNGTTTRTTLLTGLAVNPTLNDKDFALPNINPNDWDITDIPYNP